VGAMTLIPAGMASSFRAGPGDEGCTLVIGQAEVRLSAFGLLKRVKAPIFADLAHSPLVALCMSELVKLSLDDPVALGAGAMANSLMKFCILSLFQDFFGRPGIDLKIISALADPRLAPVIAAVLEQPQAAHTLPAMAAMAGLGRSTFARLFAEAMGQPPTEFVAKTRLYYAAELLRTGNAPVKAVAMSVGFSSRSHFSRAFREAYGADPTAYRQQQTGDPQTPVPQDLKRIVPEDRNG
jgi:AraC-like DNA-binding protein